MLSTSKYQKCIPIARIHGGSNHNMIIYLHEDGIDLKDIKATLTKELGSRFSSSDIDKFLEGKTYEECKELNISDDGEFRILPDQERSVNFYAAASGAGKSYNIDNFIEEYIKNNPNNEIFQISSKNEGEDPAFYPRFANKIMYVPFSSLTRPIDHTKFGDCIFIFDDTETITGMDIPSSEENRQRE